MDIHLRSTPTDELLAFHKRLDAEIRYRLLDGASWNEIKDQVDFLSDISKELAKRHISPPRLNDTPANSAVRDQRNLAAMAPDASPPSQKMLPDEDDKNRTNAKRL